MDKNTVIGFVLIAAVLIGFSYLNRPSEEEEIARRKAYNDSIALVREAEQLAFEQATENEVLSEDNATQDSLTLANYRASLGDFKSAAEGEEQYFTLENDLVEITLTNKGGRVVSAKIKQHLGQDSLPVELFNQEDSEFNLTFSLRNNHIINTSSMFFEVITDENDAQKLTFRLNSDDDSTLDFVYTLPADDYMLDFAIQPRNMQKIMPLGGSYIIAEWFIKVKQQEKGRRFEERYSTLNYKFLNDDIEKLSESKDDKKNISNRLKWIAFKDQYFSSILIADEYIEDTRLSSKVEDKNSGYMKSFTADMTLEFDPKSNKDIGFKFFFGPNHYKTLANYDKHAEEDSKLKLHRLIPLGWGIFGWVSRFAIIPMFNFFSSFIGNFGVIILLMTLVIKLVLFPLTYKSYISSAKMRVLKPEIDAINARIPAEKAAERQKATMDLYGKVGVSPFSGCLPTVLQMPILFAMFMFFPNSIELRGESFLWATDLSSYDAIFSWEVYIPFLSNFYGNHISLFTLLMTVTTLLSTKLNMANTATPDQPGAGMMKYMMYFMPIMFMFIFNSYASGLTYYYFVSTLITVLQTYAIRKAVNEEKLLAQLHAKRAANAKKPAEKKKSSFMERLEKMQKEQQKMMREQSKKKK